MSIRLDEKLFSNILFTILSGSEFAPLTEPQDSLEDAWKLLQFPEGLTSSSFYLLYSFDVMKGYKVYGQKNINKYFPNIGKIENISQTKLLTKVHKKQVLNFIALAVTGIYLSNEDSRFLGRAGVEKFFTSYQVAVPMKIGNNEHYSHIIQTTEPIVLDRNRRVVGVLNRYKILSEYDGEPLKPYFKTNLSFIDFDIDVFSVDYANKYRYYLNLVYKLSGRKKPFTNLQIEILLKYGEEKIKSIAHLAKKFDVDYRTMYDHYNNIAERADANFTINLEGADTPLTQMHVVYTYLRNCSYLPGRKMFSTIKK